MIHNESVNIWSHLLPLLFFLFLLISFFMVAEDHQFKN
ncbi:MAG: hemolysin III family protein [Bdellovibrionales bacterium]|nr:hemolysin III family protein [Bdellovibrionales bacterium]